MEKDIRNQDSVEPRDVRRLNFIRNDSGPYVFRSHIRRGLRSHILEVLRKNDLDMESRGVVHDGLRTFPPAIPVKMLRIFRRKFSGLSEALGEIRRFQRVRRFLTSSHLALSNEFIVDYKTGESCQILLCGLQEYVSGAELDPWHPDPFRYMMDQYAFVTGNNPGDDDARQKWEAAVVREVADFVMRIKAMIRKEGLIPDLAGVRNILASRRGQVKLVDINNISFVRAGEEIHLDDLGYPVCDKSIEVLHRLETLVLGRNVAGDDLYRTFLDPPRTRRVGSLVDSFNAYICASGFCEE